MEHPVSDVTQLLCAATAGDKTALSRVFELVYAELKRAAHRRLRHNSISSLHTTALVHDSFMRLSERGILQLGDRAAFMRYVGRVMRNVIVDHVRAERALKRGGGVSFVSLVTGVEKLVLDDERLLAIDAALEVLAAIAPESHQLVDMRYFGGLSLAEIAALTGQSERTVARAWSKARALLLQLTEEGHG